MKIFKYLFLYFILFLFSCSDDALYQALIKGAPGDVTNFTSILGNDSVYLTWTNPDDNNFNEVVIKRRLDMYPVSYDDPAAINVYQGSSESYTDTDVDLNETYYYTLYTTNKKGAYSQKPQKTYKKVLAFYEAIRSRCFYLIGGSSSYGDPFDNLVSQVDAFDPVTNTVYPNITTLPTPRYGCAIASLEGKIYVFGGIDSNRNVVARVDVLNVTSSFWPENIWSIGTNMPLPRYSLKAETISNRIYVFGGSSGYYGESLSPGYLNNVYQQTKSSNHIYVPNNDIWIVDDSLIPVMYNRTMNFCSGVYGGNIFYHGGRINGGSTFTNAGYIHNMQANYPIANALISTGVIVTLAESAGIVYNRKLADNSDFVIFLVLGGTTTTPSFYEPIRINTTEVDLTAVTTCYYSRFPNPSATTPTWVNSGSSLNTARAYASAEYYGDYVYVFCGIGNSGTNLNSIERLTIDNTGAFSGTWTTLGTTELSLRFAFDITKVNF